MQGTYGAPLAAAGRPLKEASWQPSGQQPKHHSLGRYVLSEAERSGYSASCGCGSERERAKDVGCGGSAPLARRSLQLMPLTRAEPWRDGGPCRSGSCMDGRPGSRWGAVMGAGHREEPGWAVLQTGRVGPWPWLERLRCRSRYTNTQRALHCTAVLSQRSITEAPMAQQPAAHHE